MTDHLDGVLLIDRLDDATRKLAMRGHGFGPVVTFGEWLSYNPGLRRRGRGYDGVATTLAFWM